MTDTSMGEINRSIEKMSLTTTTTTTTTEEITPQKPSITTTTKLLASSQRRDSNWTGVSSEEEGYGSLKSDDLISSRRGSAFSSLSQVSLHI